MKLTQRIAARLGYVKAAGGVTSSEVGDVRDGPFVAKINALLGDGRTYGGRQISETSAMQIAAVWSCVRILAETIAALPLAVYERDSKGNSRKVDHDLAYLLNEPNRDMTGQEYREAGVSNLALRGNCYSSINKLGSGTLTSLYPLPARDVTPRRQSDGTIIYRYDNEDIPADRIWHVKGFGSNGLTGLSPIGAAAQAMGLSLTMEEFGARFFANGARVSGIVKAKEWMTDKQRPIARENINQLYGGLENAHKLMLLEGGMDYAQLSVVPEEAQFLESRNYQVAEICRFYRVPPHMVADLTRATFSNIEQMSLEFVTFTLMPYLVRFEQSGAKALLPAADRRRYFIRHNFEGLLRADSAARAALYSVLLQNGVYNRNEVRALENLPYSSDVGMNDYTVQSNMTVVQLLEQLSRANAQPAPAPAPAPAP